MDFLTEYLCSQILQLCGIEQDTFPFPMKWRRKNYGSPYMAKMCWTEVLKKRLQIIPTHRVAIKNGPAQSISKKYGGVIEALIEFCCQHILNVLRSDHSMLA